jgi:hypothetical protein
LQHRIGDERTRHFIFSTLLLCIDSLVPALRAIHEARTASTTVCTTHIRSRIISHFQSLFYFKALLLCFNSTSLHMFNIPHGLAVPPQQNKGGSSVNPTHQQNRMQPAGAAGGSQHQQQQQQQQQLQLQQILASGLLQNAAAGSNTSSSNNQAGNNLLQQLQLLAANLPRGTIQAAPTLSAQSPTTSNPAFEARSSSRTDVTEQKDKLFPYILHGLLDDVEKADHTSIISWSADGKTFQIHSKALFTSQILRLYFQHKGFDEFRAQLDAWGFCDEQAGFFHPCFVRGQPMLCRHMRCSRKPYQEVRCFMFVTDSMMGLEVME